MTMPSFFDLRSTHNPYRWHLPVSPDLCVGPPGNLFMFGGVGLAAAIAAMESTCGRPTVWATAQYLSYARPGSTVDFDVRVPVEGKYNSQARAVAHIADKEILTVNAALGARPDELSHQWATAPEVPRPEACEPIEHWTKHPEPDLHSRLDVRVVKGRYGKARAEGGFSKDGHVVLWARPNGDHAIDSAVLAIIADHVPSAIGNAIGKQAGGNSLDNTIRFIQVVPTDWVLCDIHIQGIHGGFVHGQMNIFAEDGRLMATASQSMILRIHEKRKEP